MGPRSEDVDSMLEKLRNCKIKKFATRLKQWLRNLILAYDAVLPLGELQF